jgi:hypothetical protein
MATYTRAEFVRAVLLELGVIDANAAPEAADYTLADDRTQQVFEALYDDGLIPFDLDGAVPARYFLPLVQIVAEVLVAPFGKPNRAEMMAVNSRRATKALHKLRQADYISAPTPATYY